MNIEHIDSSSKMKQDTMEDALIMANQQSLESVVVLNGEIQRVESGSEVKEKWTPSSSSSEASSEDSSSSEVLGPKCLAFLHRRHRLLKLIFMISVVTVITLAISLLKAQWLLPYYYAISAPLLLSMRIVMYWKYKWQYFLIDFCYVGNLLVYIYMWAIPENLYVFNVIFGIANGPLAWAVWMFRNSLVLHSFDRMTSCFIHIVPAFLTYVIRWYPEIVSEHWYSPFPSSFDIQLPQLLIYLSAIPFGCYVAHNMVYICIVFGCCKPEEEYFFSYRYITSPKSQYYKIVNCCGPKLQPVMYHLCYWTFAVTSLIFVPLWYNFFIAHSIFIIGVCLVVTWNGASWYMDIFGVRGHAADNV